MFYSKVVELTFFLFLFIQMIYMYVLFNNKEKKAQ